MKQLELTYEEIEFLKSKNKKVFVEDIQGFTEVKSVFNKELEGTLIEFDDGSEIKCAITHNMLSNNEWKTPYELSVGDHLQNRYGKNSKQITAIKDVPRQKWIDFEVSNEFESYIQNDVIHHNSGKSLIIFIFLMYMKSINKKSALVVPSINLVSQMFTDFEDYGMKNPEKHIRQIGGEFKDKDIKALPIIISTWQSLQNFKEKEFEVFDAIVVDEAHTAGADSLTNIINNSINAEWKLGLTGTVPKARVLKLALLGTLGRVFKVITAGKLIERGLATPIRMNCLFLNYSESDRKALHKIAPKLQYPDEEKFIAQHYHRNKKVSDIIQGLSKSGNVLALFSKIEHGNILMKNAIIARTGNSNFELLHKMTPKPMAEAFEIFKADPTKLFYMNSEICPKQMEKSRKKLQKTEGRAEVRAFLDNIISLRTINVYMINGSVSGTSREDIRAVLETVHSDEITLEFGDIAKTVSEDFMVPLENGKTIRAGDVTMDTDVSEAWVKS